ncbi:MAG: glycosyltransferase [Pseudomonadota bacterium]
MTSPRFSVIVNTYNRGAHLEHTLRGLTALDYPDYEIVVVNGPSTDDTADRLTAWHDRIKYVDCGEANLAASRNEGIAAAAGDIVAFIDDDAVPHPTWLTALARAYGDPRVAGAGGFTLDNTGARWQCRKTVCDRFGEAHHVSPFFDTGPLNRPGSPFYPSLLGTNSSFRRAALAEIGGFDDMFAYLLDETDVCLRLVDAGHRIVYVPEALIFHQFAESHIRNAERVPRTLYPSARSKAYFVHRHGHRALPSRTGAALEAYERGIRGANPWLEREGRITPAHRASLDADLGWGIASGTELARRNDRRSGGSLGLRPPPPGFRPAAAPRGAMRLVFVSRGYPPAVEAGIARWTESMATGLAARGHEVHVICEGVERSLSYQGGIWRHAIPATGGDPDGLGARWGLPPGAAAWAAAVAVEVERIGSFSPDVVSFPVWDLEGIGCVGGRVPTVMSLHTTYALSRPFRSDWKMRPVYTHAHVDRMIAAERRVLAEHPCLLANSEAVVRDLSTAYDVDLTARATVVSHGTPDTGAGSWPRPDGSVLFLGRFEQRKGFDLAAAAISRLLTERPGARAIFAGDLLNDEARELLRSAGAEGLAQHASVEWAGALSREALAKALRRASLVLFPSRYESFGLVAIEAFAAATPVVALNNSGPAEVVRHGETGLLITPGDGEIARLTTAMADLLDTPRRMSELGLAARAEFEARFTVGEMCAAAEEVYRRAAGGDLWASAPSPVLTDTAA